MTDEAFSTFEEACDEADAEESRRIEPEELARLARLPPLEYDRQRAKIAERLGVRVATLDKVIRKMWATDKDDGALPHWTVEPSSQPVDGAALLYKLRQVFRHFIFLPKGADVALPLWVLHAWTYDAGDVSPFMVLLSPTKRCGKTSVMILLQYLTPRSELASNITGPALFRYIEAVRPTLLIDEADSFVKDNEELRGILNSGHTKVAANVIRSVEVNGEHQPRRFSTWAPKAIATIRSLADTLEDRAIIVQLQRKPPGAKVERLRKRDNEWFAALRAKLSAGRPITSIDWLTRILTSPTRSMIGQPTTGVSSWRLPTSPAGSGLSWLARPPSRSQARPRTAPSASSC
jgi:putative DNA primase/helicase